MEKDILNIFLYNEKLKFNEIEKKLKVRSNKLSYHLTKLVQKGVLIKNKETYSLSETSEYLIPHLSDKTSLLTAVIIHLGNNDKCFLITRNKKPFKGKLALPGGRILNGEKINDSVKRIMKDKYHIEASLDKIHSVSIEHVKEKGKIFHSFLLIFVSAKTKEKIILTSIKENKNKIISSDYSLIKTHLNHNLKIQTFTTKK